MRSLVADSGYEVEMSSSSHWVTLGSWHDALFRADLQRIVHRADSQFLNIKLFISAHTQRITALQSPGANLRTIHNRAKAQTSPPAIGARQGVARHREGP